jgi:hypothetical protein
MNNIGYYILAILLFFYFVGLQSTSVFIIGCPTSLKYCHMVHGNHMFTHPRHVEGMTNLMP